MLSDGWSQVSRRTSTGCPDEIKGRMREYLQGRARAANSKSLCYGFDSEGTKVLTLPRGFYLRSSFTEQIMKESLMQARSATIADLMEINQFIRDSKSFWGYSESFLNAFMERWGVKSAYF